MLKYNFIQGLDSKVSDQNNQFSNCVKDIKVEQHSLNEIYATENRSSTERSKGIVF